MRGDPRPPQRRIQPLTPLPPLDAPAAAISSGTRIATRVQNGLRRPSRAPPQAGNAANWFSSMEGHPRWDPKQSCACFLMFPSFDTAW
ncbi:homeobox protein Hox-D4 isoform X2 [Corapipo altera]|uniref:homeobox protein Hox-D4 isoform X2 n=1 Tax=Corapipo altera TaxID=415028 RepID=UPI000FD656AF|nr:homeobox protein Hox-D4 isoform X2 [Corapipo altera]